MSNKSNSCLSVFVTGILTFLAILLNIITVSYGWNTFLVPWLSLPFMSWFNAIGVILFLIAIQPTSSRIESMITSNQVNEIARKMGLSDFHNSTMFKQLVIIFSNLAIFSLMNVVNWIF